METLRKQLLLTVLAAAAILAGGWLLLVSPKQDEAQLLREQAAAQELQHSQLQTRLGVLRAKAEALPEKQAELAEVSRRIPTKVELPDLVRALSEAARSADVELVSVTPGEPVPVVDANAAAPAAPVAPAAPADAAAPPAPAPAPAPALSSIPLSIEVTGQYFSLEQFLAELEELPRALRVTGLVVKPGAAPGAGGRQQDGSSLTSSITAEVYVATGTAAGTAAPATTAAPSTTAAPAPAIATAG